jgi:hypothetical protein
MRFSLPSLFGFLTLVAGAVLYYEREPLLAMMLALASIWILLESQRGPKMPN